MVQPGGFTEDFWCFVETIGTYLASVFIPGHGQVPPSGVDADLSHLEYPNNVFGFALDPSQPAVDQLEEYLTGATLCSFPLVS